MSMQEFMRQSKLTNKPLNEKIIKQVGFHRRWLDDKSGYWWEKTLPSRIIPVNILYDRDTNELVLRVKILSDFKPYRRNLCWEQLQVLPATVLNLKRILVNGTLIAAAK